MTGPRIRFAWLRVPVTACAVVTVALVVLWADLSSDERRAVGDLLTAPRIGLTVFFLVTFLGTLGFVAFRSMAPVVSSARRIVEAVRLIAHGNPAYRVSAGGPPELDAIADAINDLAQVRSELIADMESSVSEAKAHVEEERKRLAALVSELDQSVLVCNRDGRVLLYNAAAQALLGAPGTSGPSELLGLGRSVFSIIDRALILHALEAMEDQMARDERESTHFVTATRDGRLLRVQAAPVLAAGTDPVSPRELAGYVLLLSDVTEHINADAKLVVLFQKLVETTRAALANIRAAIENLTEYPEMDIARRKRFAAIIRDESVNLSEHLDRHAAVATDGLKSRWPLEEMRGEDLLTLACRRIERRTGLLTKVETADASTWLRVDSFSVAQALSYIGWRLNDEFEVREVRFRLVPAGGHAQLDLLWRGPPMSSETAFAWQSDPFTLGGEDSRLNLVQVMERHAGEAWYQRDVPSQLSYFRFLLPLAVSRAGVRPRSALESRPEFYDFDLFRRSPATDALDDRPLADLAYTVFDTETTGLDPESDEIIAIGAVRIVNGRLLKDETFESLVDPRRSLSESSIAIHGITRDSLTGQPTIDTVLPRFHRFAEETVLVGHNAAFDMRFLKLKEAQTGVRFTQPVLDTLLLSAIAYPAQNSHSLEDIAQRLDVNVVGRHTALGDAVVTGEAFLRLIQQLAQRGIRTLGEARAASKQTYYARLKY